MFYDEDPPNVSRIEYPKKKQNVEKLHGAKLLWMIFLESLVKRSSQQILLEAICFGFVLHTGEMATNMFKQQTTNNAQTTSINDRLLWKIFTDRLPNTSGQA